MKYQQNKVFNLILILVLVFLLCITPNNASYAGESFEREVTAKLNEEVQFPKLIEDMDPAELTKEIQSVIESSGLDQERLANLDISRELYIKLINSFSQKPVPEASDYPDWYGGCYMNDQGKLVIYVTRDYYSEGDRLSMVKDKVINIIGSDDVLFEPCDFSFRYLTETMDYLNNIKLNAKSSTAVNNFNSFGIYDKENRIFVFLDTYNDKSIQDFKKNVCDRDCIVFVKAEGAPVDQVNVDPGDRIQTLLYGGSVAYRAKLNGVNGIVTAGHGATTTEPGKNWVKYNGVIFAVCTKRQNSGSVDAAFCEITNSNYEPTNIVMSGSIMTSTLNPSVGDVVYKLGAKGGWSGGTVVSTNYSGTFDGVFFTNLSQAEYSSENGDSGGIICTFNMSTNLGYTVGIHKGRGGGYGVYTKASLANSALGITRY